MKRNIIEIDEKKCTGCGLCIPECKEGAIQIIDGKARLISDLFCDGLGACLGYCPEGAITVVEKEAEPYDESKVIMTLVDKPKAVLAAHLKHLVEHNETENLKIAFAKLEEIGIENPVKEENQPAHSPGCGCQGSKMIDRRSEDAQKINVCDSVSHNESVNANSTVKSELKQWPIQLHLVNPSAPYFKNTELVVLSTCSPIAFGDVQKKYVRDRAIVIACPKLDYTAPYTQKLTEIFSIGNTSKVTVVLMEVPCCKGLMKFVTEAKAQSGRDDLIIEEHIITLEGKLKTVNYM